VQPGAKKSAVVGLHGEALKIRVAAPPVEGRANEALIVFLAERLGVPKGLVSIAKGENSRAKLVRVACRVPDPHALFGNAAETAR
jgi:uncharacterized protein